MTKQLQAALNRLGFLSNVFSKLIKVARNNPDPMSVLLKDIDPNTPVSPRLIAAVQDKRFVKVLREHGIYNVVCMGYNNRTWTFMVIFARGKVETIEVAKLQPTGDIVFEDAVGHAVLEALQRKQQELAANEARAEEINAEIEYPPTTSLEAIETDQAYRNVAAAMARGKVVHKPYPKFQNFDILNIGKPVEDA